MRNAIEKVYDSKVRKWTANGVEANRKWVVIRLPLNRTSQYSRGPHSVAVWLRYSRRSLRASSVPLRRDSYPSRSHCRHIQDLSLTTILQREKYKAANIGGQAWKRDRRVTMVGGGCCEQDIHYLRPPSYIDTSRARYVKSFQAGVLGTTSTQLCSSSPQDIMVLVGIRLGLDNVFRSITTQ